MNDLDLKKNIWEILHTVKTRMEKLMAPIAQEEGLTPLQIFILLVIQKRRITSVGELIRITGINQGNASTICKKLENSGFIQRKRNSEDERVVSLLITEKGNQALFRINQKMDKLIELLDDYPTDKLISVYKGFYEFDAILKQLEEHTIVPVENIAEK